MIEANVFAPQALLIILLMALVLFGGKQLPEGGRALGQAIREFHRATSEPHAIDGTYQETTEPAEKKAVGSSPK